MGGPTVLCNHINHLCYESRDLKAVKIIKNQPYLTNPLEKKSCPISQNPMIWDWLVPAFNYDILFVPLCHAQHPFQVLMIVDRF
jgi:hypothetical protein